jgi:hypothetical protein
MQSTGVATWHPPTALHADGPPYSATFSCSTITHCKIAGKVQVISELYEACQVRST